MRGPLEDAVVEDSAKVRILPPIVLASTLAAGLGIGWFAPAPILDRGAAIILGALAMTCSVALVLSALFELRRAGTAFDVRKSSTALVTTGAYAVSRNPTYLSMVMLFVGVAFLANSWWTLLLAAPLGSALCRLAILPEEAYLAAKFGKTYEDYRARVRRWA
jgi:protein-S-isoprenylcysteine O-methyltransferase Ste14